MILAREMGMALELPDVDVRTLVPEALKDGSAHLPRPGLECAELI